MTKFVVELLSKRPLDLKLCYPGQYGDSKTVVALDPVLFSSSKRAEPRDYLFVLHMASLRKVSISSFLAQSKAKASDGAKTYFLCRVDY